MLYSAAIQAHPSRRQHAEQTAALLDAPIAWSRTPGDVWDTHKRARLLCDPQADFSLVVQDDVILGTDFHRRLETLLTEHGDQHAYCLFYRHKRRSTHGAMIDAARAGEPAGGFVWPRMQWCQATLIPSRLVPEMIAHCDADPGRKDQDDLLIGRWLKSIGMQVLYPLPSLVDHKADAASLLYRGTNQHRVAWRFA